MKITGKRAVCDCCGQIWNVSAHRDVSRVYVCPQCERRLDGRGVYEGGRSGKKDVRKLRNVQ